MANIKIPKGLLKGAGKVLKDNADGALKYIGKNAPKVFNLIAKKGAPVVAVIKDHAVEMGLGVLVGAVGIDDINQRVKRKAEKLEHEKHEKLAAEQIKKQNAEIQILSDKAEDADRLVVINEILCDEIKRLKEDDEEEE